MVIDSHCHLDYFQEDEINAIIARAKDKNVEILHTICTKLSEVNKIISIAEKYDNVYSSVGVHPNDVKSEQPIDKKKLLNFAKHKKVISIGETGLDYHYETSPCDLQQQSFKMHIDVARNSGLPLIIHARDADDDMIEILEKEYQKGEFKAVMHSFASTEKLCNVALNLGFYISFSGIVTFKNAKNIQEIAEKVPIERMLIETDSPFLAPIPHRGKRNEPAFVIHVAEYLKGLLGCDNISEVTTENFLELFNI